MERAVAERAGHGDRGSDIVRFNSIWSAGRRFTHLRCRQIALAKAGVPYENETASPGSIAQVRVGKVGSAVLLHRLQVETLSKR